MKVLFYSFPFVKPFFDNSHPCRRDRSPSKRTSRNFLVFSKETDSANLKQKSIIFMATNFNEFRFLSLTNPINFSCFSPCSRQISFQPYTRNFFLFFFSKKKWLRNPFFFCFFFCWYFPSFLRVFSWLESENFTSPFSDLYLHSLFRPIFAFPFQTYICIPFSVFALFFTLSF